ncbi:RNA polymerase factor sigma-54 [Parvularcula sp. ZS-1/3]|uniref:RNA polymerase sigma-54 factor n=1 Tax=Parvularcula mediterranea TaxID=2732508 RepID=A0A7Y3RLV5_9PROT|nr:RNA polymerase factor sigma-54 [Parvularcula mediterranea]NNU15990.1 RNA polymerase factor sigma-54 [Parvularcula mediterranea]
MSMTGRLEARQSQQLTMTPQLQQAIKLLQLSNLELQDFVEERLLENPFLERGEAEGDGDSPAPDAASSSSEPSSDAGPADGSDEPPVAPRERIRENNSGGQAGGEDFDAAANVSVEKSLSEVLNEQLVMALRDPVQQAIGRYLIDLVEDSGYLTTDLSMVAERLGCPEDDIEDVLAVIQRFEPSGIAARSLSECLALQLHELGLLSEEMDLFLKHLDLLGSHKLNELKKVTGLDDQGIRDAVVLIKSCNPKPGLAYGSDHVQVVVPDVYVGESSDGGWKVELNSATLPRVIANEQYYATLSKEKQSPDSKTFLQEQINDANWLVRSLDQRARTILKVSSEIVRYQDGFFAHGIRHLRPLNLKTVAEAIEMHESTVSRVTTGKYIHTPRGVFEMKYFFTAAIPSSGGEEQYSAESVRHVIKSLIDEEDPLKPLSDDQLVDALAAQDIAIARRTIAKYRQSLGIASSVERKRAAKQAIG